MDAIQSISQKQLRHFAFLVGGIFAGIFGILFPFLKHRPLPLIPLFIGVGLILVGALAPGVLKPVYQAWMKVGGVLGKINGAILLSLIYFLIIVPIGIFKRLRGRDPMSRTQDPKLPSYRIQSQETPTKAMEEVF